ncbi:hypothetical protein [Leifsonia poae]|uniref:Uncharacterized protein n=1 Tax=Leifsonia poae TaxID=110933 RepID=A0A9W6M1F6_9MICO|nr:hypothetical protein [Leifsonia poae]GLJ77821.1 hypothetical protein GCM10017584_33950 [Leifsonia poae]
MISTLLVFTIAVVDVVMGVLGMPEPHDDRRGITIPPRVIIAGVVAALVLPALGLIVLGLSPFAVGTIALFAWVWIWLECEFVRRSRNGWFLAAAIAFVVLVSFGLFVDAGARDEATLVTAFNTYAHTVGLHLTFELLFGAVAVVLVLTRTSNLICRAAFGRTVSAERPSLPQQRRWTLSLRSRELASVAEETTSALREESDDHAATTLKGGRVIGPFERILITALGLFGAEAVIVGLLAAKGIVRFPEISADGRKGSKAEEFLVGSLVSWTIAGLCTAYLFVLRNGL